ncbi:hypothetical protein AMATHDRAFT_146744 [Amanita thiersii Skay4041]|uniref:Pyridoxamine 5'-phosphate oxidase Alr4036 family FMN-binding domain-containing protein n=1 Tax=Amanita thiersii Skay4041 TaxID=703135 RepID=A0A2A9NI87_9AGAR|nr:hypothetical protein AMATHDRAFT_146744 [Amanita thiersii Skay4041]
MTTPRWVIAIKNAIADYEKQTVFQLASIDPNAPLPQVRSHVLRSFLTPPNAPSLPLIVTTTDIRTPKISQIISNPHVQIAYWIDGTQQQFRIAGRAAVIPSPQNDLYKQFMHDILTSTGKLESMAGIAALATNNFDWEKERINIFKSLSGHMKATWCRPVPGSLLSNQEEANKWPVKIHEPTLEGSDEERRNWELALSNFALLIVDPIECDFLELGVIPNRRTKFTRIDNGHWAEEALVP